MSSKKQQRSLSPLQTLQTSDVSSPSCNSPDQRESDISSPFGSRVFSPPSTNALLTSELDGNFSSPLNFGTPSSRLEPIKGVTPLRGRIDIGVKQKVREINIIGVGEQWYGDSSGGTKCNSEGGADTHLVIWGTDVNIMDAKRQFVKFLKECVVDIPREERIDLESRMHLYLKALEEVSILEEPFLPLNSDHLRQYDSALYSQLVRYPQEIIPTFDLAANELYNNLYPESILPHQIQVRPYNVKKTKNIRFLSPNDIDHLITISGMVIRSTHVLPEMREAFFQCYICHEAKTVEIDRGRIVEPALCTNCQSLHSMTLLHNRSMFSDKQIVKIQESPEDMPSGQTPHTVMLHTYHDLVDAVQPGDRVTVTGIYRATPLRVNPRARTVKAVYKTYIDVVHFCKMDDKRLRERHNEEHVERQKKAFPAEKVELLKQLSCTPDIYERLAKALAPNIYENDDIKKGILLQLFGGTKKDLKNTGRGRFRAEINILLCGDPGTSKSQLLQYVHSLMPRGQYTSGKGSSAVGLTAYVTKDPETGQLVLQTGALVLSDHGICCIDEFDKMNESARCVLHEVMEQQTLSIAKAGIICSLNARTSILAAANPRMSLWDEKMTVVENIKLPHTLLSRFDLIFLMLDPQHEHFDRRLATHLVSLYHQTKDDEESLFMDMSTLKDYIAYARTYIHPSLSEEAGQALVQAYVEMRKIGNNHGAVTAYPRQLESMIRLAEAHAKMRFSKTVEVVDVEEAKRLHKEALKQAATDPKTGIIDIGILTTGVSNSERQQRESLAGEIKKMLQIKKTMGFLGSMKISAILEAIKEQSQIGISPHLFDAALKVLQDEEFCMVTGSNIRLP